MKLFQQRPEVQKFDTMKAFLEAFSVGEGDFILASKSIYDTYMKGLCSGAVVRFKSEYGAGEPTDGMIDALLKEFRRLDCKRVIAVGGGAVIDMAKLLVLGTDAGAEEIFGRQVPLQKERELIAVPTTCGAGSESSNVTIAEFTERRSKMGLADDALYPDYAVLIPELLRELPYSFFATSAIDALIHGIESFVSPKASLYTQMFSEKAVRMILDGFRRIASEGLESRFELLEEFLVASDLAGIAFGNAGTGAVHAMSYPLSGEYHVAHGEANYQFLTAVFRKYKELQPEGRITELDRILAQALLCAPEDVYRELECLLDQIIGRKPLREYGMKESETESFAKSVEKSQQRLLNQSYIKFDAAQMAEIYRELY
ncbi:4-hydroxybutyrate dehydrogenase [Bariatricus massiliensis]|uniref:4-hydroxybutyrate dehydrogenase n=1 Tax=Bariatricus massiliensis TaxID=1745713 RepID=A0ABS8DI78_9FIRM|nr:4-hydroxybutyrate dehydrogenase [Bariatricus massiliensis]MCB7304592.1 4-hydroxybutyrate dehydrogenase [Bariatricus massiliensis]MCB7374743.1 4-hydroxybutyrate dehydrogenase [Bariatricus massiliensis]MCB7388130.1 4-hydroxybutyrate dehydrogenase [Bariatricus massiliensis]MCB7411908.1 4-hydroxybutyrate dehydrogenase [Bariatricus massiliensis]MCQ5254301.1 4-hydroxybutyrate dehydrogenase [Bariatricus massiliensis]